MKTVLFVLAGVFLLAMGCAGTDEPPVSEIPAPPVWVIGEPVRSGMVCAVGTAEPAFYVDDARDTAAENCRGQLAHSIRTQITSVMIDEATERGNNFRSATVTQTTAAITDMVAENAQVLDYWLDEHGQASHKKNITYALCCMPGGQ